MALGELGKGLEGDVQCLGDAAYIAPLGIPPAALDFGDERGGEFGLLGEGSLGELRFLAQLVDRSGQTSLAFG